MTSLTRICRAVYEMRTYGFLSEETLATLTPDELMHVQQQTGAED
jgi:hypothetical protein